MLRGALSLAFFWRIAIKRDDFRWPAELVTVTWSEMGAEIMRSWTALLAADQGIRVRYDGTLVAPYHLAVTGATKAAGMLAGERRDPKRGSPPFAMRLVWPQARTNSGYILRGDSPISGIHDIKPGVRVVDMRGYLASQKVLDGLLAWAGIGASDVVWVPAKDAADKTRLIVDGEADIAFAVPSSPSTRRAETNPHGLRWLDCNWERDPAGARRFMRIDPLIAFGPMREGMASCHGVWGTSGSSLYISRAETDDELVYRLVGWLDANHHRFKDAHQWNRGSTLEVLLDELCHSFIPPHAGVVRYLEEKGLWGARYARRARQNAELIDRYLEMEAEAQTLAAARGVAVADDDPAWLEILADCRQRRALPDFKTFIDLDED